MPSSGINEDACTQLLIHRDCSQAENVLNTPLSGYMMTNISMTMDVTNGYCPWEIFFTSVKRNFDSTSDDTTFLLRQRTFGVFVSAGDLVNQREDDSSLTIRWKSKTGCCLSYVTYGEVSRTSNPAPR
jgi:hypothetical protein